MLPHFVKKDDYPWREQMSSLRVNTLGIILSINLAINLQRKKWEFRKLWERKEQHIQVLSHINHQTAIVMQIALIPNPCAFLDLSSWKPWAPFISKSHCKKAAGEAVFKWDQVTHLLRGPECMIKIMLPQWNVPQLEHSRLLFRSLKKWIKQGPSSETL